MYYFFNLGAVTAIHFAVMVFFPYTGKMGTPFLIVSFLLWMAFFLFMRPPLLNFQKDTIAFICLLLNLIMLTSTVTMFPQENNMSVLRKILREEYPTKKDVYIGLLRFGIKHEGLLAEIKKEEIK